MGYHCDDGPEFYHEELVTARKPHKCCETGKIIRPGEKYWRCSGKWDGRMSTFTQSRAGYHLCRYLNFQAGECIIYFGGMPEHAAEARAYGDRPIADVYDDIRNGVIDFDSEESVGKEIARREAMLMTQEPPQ